MYLGIDCGTQGTKALLIDENGLALGRGYARHALIERENGAREQEPHWWVDALRDAVKQAVSLAPKAEIVALGVSGQQHGLVVLDERMHVIRPAKLWNDTETAPQNAELIERLGGAAACLKRFGIIPMTGYTASKLLWMKEREPENFARIRYILLPHDYLNFWLTGRLCAEYGDASGTAFFDVRNRGWSREALEAISDTGQLFQALPELLTPEEIVGTVRPDIAEDLGLSPKCVVSVGGGDNMMGAIGTGNVKEGVVTLSLGTSSTVYSFRNQPISDSTGSVASFCSSSGGWLPLVCTMNATNVVTQTLNTLGKGVEDIEAALQSTRPGAEGLTFFPFLNGERTPDLPQARGSIVGASANNFTTSNLIRAVVEGVSFGILNGLDLIMEGKRANTIAVIGGGARSREWRRLLSDATGATIQMPAEEEAGCLGAAIQAMYAHGHASGNQETFVEIANRCVRVQDNGGEEPRTPMGDSYRQAKENYRRHLNEMYLQ
jgi:D-xylulose kinase